jgi:UDP-glucose 4-epimerase
MIAAMRQGLERRPNIFPCPETLIHGVLRARGQEEKYRSAFGSLVADPSALVSLGWQPQVTTPVGLRGLMGSL